MAPFSYNKPLQEYLPPQNMRRLNQFSTNQFKFSAFAGFTLVEVLLALVIVAIALTALLKATSENVSNMSKLKEKTISHWVATQAIEAIQLGLIQIHSNQETSQVTTMLGQKWYWRAKLFSTPLKNVQKIMITLSKSESGPFQDQIIGFKYKP